MNLEFCQVCYRTLIPLDGTTPGKVVTVEQCSHNFHHHCITTWCKRFSTCPVCRVRIEQIHIKNVEKDGTMKLVSSEEVPYIRDQPLTKKDTETPLCRMCGTEASYDVYEAHVCARCWEVEHFDCRPNAWKRSPRTHWWCPECTCRAIGITYDMRYNPPRIG